MADERELELRGENMTSFIKSSIRSLKDGSDGQLHHVVEKRGGPPTRPPCRCIVAL